MAGMIRPNLRNAKIAYNILKTPKDMRQQNQPRPSQRLIKQWWIDSSTAQ